MLNIIDLEKRWLRYKIKSYIPHVTIVVSLVIITILASIILDLQNADYKEKVSTTKNILEIIEVKTASIDKKLEPKKVVTPQAEAHKERMTSVVKESTTKLQPSLSFMKDMRGSSLPYSKPSTYRKSNPNTKQQVPPKAPKKKIITQTIIIEEPIVEKKEIIQKEPEVIKTTRIIINRRETKDDIDNVIKRFKVNNNPALSLFVAKKYYDIGNYHESYNYALITNQINKDIESSWIIFTKSLVKLGKKNKAINTLKDYIQDTDSRTAQLLLEEIQSGKFK